jgi:alkylhydroperoxidase family enzyme
MVGDIATTGATAAMPERTQLALRWADVLLAGGREAPAGLLDELQAAFTPAELVEITYAMGTFIGYGKQIITLGMEPEALPVIEIPTPGA